MRVARLRTQSERGVVTAMFAVLAVFLLLIISVVAEGGRKLSNLSQAEDIAAEAARSAAATLDLSQIANGVAVIDEVDERARIEANKVVAVVPGAEIERFEIANDSVVVIVRVSGESFLPGFDIDGVGSHRAQAFDPFDT
ncbi:MAG: putative methyltransferase [Acidimicrobiales bacterium]|jgi:predicted methyltransferase